MLLLIHRWMQRQQEYSRSKDAADVVTLPLMRHSSFIAGITSDASIDMDMQECESILSITYIYFLLCPCLLLSSEVWTLLEFL